MQDRFYDATNPSAEELRRKETLLRLSGPGTPAQPGKLEYPAKEDKEPAAEPS